MLRVRLRVADPRFGLAKGDVLIARRYAFDPDKVTILARESDGLDPECNRHHHDLDFLGFIHATAHDDPAPFTRTGRVTTALADRSQEYA